MFHSEYQSPVLDMRNKRRLKEPPAQIMVDVVMWELTPSPPKRLNVGNDVAEANQYSWYDNPMVPKAVYTGIEIAPRNTFAKSIGENFQEEFEFDEDNFRWVKKKK